MAEGTGLENRHTGEPGIVSSNLTLSVHHQVGMTRRARSNSLAPLSHLCFRPMRMRTLALRTTTLTVALGVSAMGCHHAPSPVLAGPRLLHPEDVEVVPFASPWPRRVPQTFGLANANGPRYPGESARLTVAFVVDRDGGVEYRTISIIDSLPNEKFVESVCDFLRYASFAWEPHEPMRGLVLLSYGVALTRDSAKLLSGSDHLQLSRLVETLGSLSPAELSEWIEARRHCR